MKYAVKEYACTAVDVLARRTRLAFLNVQAAHEALPKIVDIMAAELGWDKNRKKVCSYMWCSQPLSEEWPYTRLSW